MRCKASGCNNTFRTGFRLFRHNGEWFCWIHLPKVTKDKLPKYKHTENRPLSTVEAKRDAARVR